MLDCQGKELNIGDRVVAIDKRGQACSLKEGYIQSFKIVFGTEQAIVERFWHGVTSQNIYKI